LPLYFCGDFVLSAALNQQTEWNYRIIDQRLIVVKTKNEQVRKVAVLDVLTNLPIAINVAAEIDLENLQADQEYLAHLKVYTSKDMAGVDKDFLGFFEALDVDQTIEDFIKAYWIYPNKIRFELVDVEEP
jgi:hypothetical protein